MHRDLPPEAHAKAIAALDEFDATLVEYTMLLDSTRALVRARNFDAVAEMTARGDAVARAAAACGERVAALCAEAERGAFAGPRAQELLERWRAAGARAQQAESGSAALAALCLAERERAGSELERSPAARPGSAAREAYRPAARPLAIDRRG
jgi:hypothetical protein